MIYVVVYDIEDDKVRNRIAKALENFGQRVQESVFECWLDDKELAEMTEKLAKELGEPENGNIRMYRVCGNCMTESFGMGAMVKSYNASLCIIV